MIWLQLVLVAVVAMFGWAVWRFVRSSRLLRMRLARDLFHQRREWLEADFLKSASRSGRPRGLSWADCQFDDSVTFARDRYNRQLRALVAVTIQFEAVVGGGMELVEAVGNLRSATAVFRHENGRWVTDGRAVFNLSPEETIRHFAHELESV